MWLALCLDSYPNMALQSEEQWAAQLQVSGVPTMEATWYEWDINRSDGVI